MPVIAPFQILPSTTSHKSEALIPTLEVFARLGLTDLDLNLNHLIERGTAAADVRAALAANGQRVFIASGGWCDFFDQPPQIQTTFDSVERATMASHTAFHPCFGYTWKRMPLPSV